MPIGLSMLDAIDEAIASTPWYIPNAPVFYVTGRREIAGFIGTRVKGEGAEPVGDEEKYWGLVEPATHPGVTFSFTRRQCKQIRKAARREAERAVQGR